MVQTLYNVSYFKIEWN